MDDWRAALSALPNAPRSDAAAWAFVEELPAHPILAAATAIRATGRSKPRVYDALASLENAGVLRPLSYKRRDRSWAVYDPCIPTAPSTPR